jgi:hypothetical protein
MLSRAAAEAQRWAATPFLEPIVLDKPTLLAAVTALLNNIHAKGSSFAYAQGVRQFNSLLGRAKLLYPTRPDIQSIASYDHPSLVNVFEFEDVAMRLKSALELVPSTSAGQLLAQVKLPSDAPADVALDLAELEGALGIGLEKTILLLAASIAESLLIVRHPDTSSKGPGLRELVKQARTQNLFATDTLKLLEMLIDYRDLIHARAQTRNRTVRSPARVDAAISALKLLCEGLQDTTVRYT